MVGSSAPGQALPKIDLLPFDAHSPYLQAAIAVYAETWRRGFQSSSDFILGYGLKQEDFIGFVAVDYSHQQHNDLDASPSVVAMGFGTRSRSGQWWHDHVTRQVGPRHPALQNAWVITELAVASSHRNQGLGTRIHNALLEAQPYERVLLSTQRDNLGARRLYERLGWRYLHRGFAFEKGGPSFVIMHRLLRRNREATTGT